MSTKENISTKERSSHTFRSYINAQKPRKNNIQISLIEDITNEYQYNNNKGNEKIGIDVVCNLKGNYPTKIRVYGNGRGMNKKQMHNDYWTHGSANKEKGRGYFGEGSKQGIYWGMKKIFSLYENNVYESYVEPYKFLNDALPRIKDEEFTHEFPNENEMDIQTLSEKLKSKSGTLCEISLLEQFAKKYKWDSIDGITNNIDELGKNYLLRHVLSSSKINVYISDEKKSISKNIILGNPNGYNLIEDETYIISAAQIGIANDKSMNDFLNNDENLKKSFPKFNLKEEKIILNIGEIASPPDKNDLDLKPHIRKSGIMYRTDNGEYFDNNYGTSKNLSNFRSGINPEFSRKIGGSVEISKELFQFLQNFTEGGFIDQDRNGLNQETSTVAKNILNIVSSHVKEKFDEIKSKNLDSDYKPEQQDTSSIANEWYKIRSEIIEDEEDIGTTKPLLDIEFKPNTLPIKTGETKSASLWIKNEIIKQLNIDFFSIDTEDHEIAHYEENKKQQSIESEDELIIKNIKFSPVEKFQDYKKGHVNIRSNMTGATKLNLNLKLQDGTEMIKSMNIHVHNNNKIDIPADEIRFQNNSLSAELDKEKQIRILVGESIGEILTRDQVEIILPPGCELTSEHSIELDEDSKIGTSDGYSTLYFIKFGVTIKDAKFDIGTIKSIVQDNYAECKIRKKLYRQPPKIEYITEKIISQQKQNGGTSIHEVVLKDKKPYHIELGNDENPDSIYILTPHKIYNNKFVLNDEGNIIWEQSNELKKLALSQAAYGFGIHFQYLLKEEQENYNEKTNAQKLSDIMTYTHKLESVLYKLKSN